ncbi:MAG: GDSL-type esterase/lipase family protein [Akkermansia sp.]
MSEMPIITARLDEDGALELTKPCANDGTHIRYCYPWDGHRLLFIQGEYLAPIEPSPGLEVRFRLFSGRKGISEMQSFTFPCEMGEQKLLPTTMIPRTQNRDFMAYDWGARHRAVCATVSQRKPKLVLLGDSITHFWGGDPVDPPLLDYVRMAPDIWDDCMSGLSCVNLGFGNDRIENALWRVLHGELDGTHPEALCCLLIGTNNFSENTNAEITEGLCHLCEMIKNRLPHGKLLIQGIYPRGEVGSDTRNRMNELNETWRRLPLLDGHQVFYHDTGACLLRSDGTLKDGVSRDGVHPSRAGYGLIAQELAPQLKNILF